MNRYKVTLKLDDEKTNVMVYAHNSDIAKNIVTNMMHCALNKILEVYNTVKIWILNSINDPIPQNCSPNTPG